MLDPDYHYALLLQEQFKHEVELESGSDLVYKRAPQVNKSKSLVDPSWELIDPTPDIHNLFVIFNQRFFWGKLVTVCVSWSKRMTTCAGICSYQGRGGMCSITLSEPLLKLRPRKDLVETLLHEMIHAYLFVTHNNKDRSGHGPEFHKHMYRINAEAGTNITVYHDFHDEVRLYQQHWWRCDGPCQKWKPYFGIVRRATNRAPGPNDFWWAEHSRNCGGNFIKVKEPENFKKKSNQKDKPTVNPKNDIRNFFGNSQTTSNNSHSGSQSNSNIVGFKDLGKNKAGTAVKNSSSTIVITKNSKTNSSATENKPNIVTPEPFSGVGKVLTTSKMDSGQDNPDYSVVRNHWINKFQNNIPQKPHDSEDKKRPSSQSETSSIKRPKITVTSLSTSSVPEDNPKDCVSCPICGKKIEKSSINEHLDKCLMESNKEKEENDLDFCFICNETVAKRNLNSHVDSCLNKLSEDGKIKCDVCCKTFDRDVYSEHFRKCLNDVFSEDIKEDNMYKVCTICNENVKASSFDEHVEKCLHNIYNASVPLNSNNNNSKNGNQGTDEKNLRKRNVSEEQNQVTAIEERDEEVPCLACGKRIIKSELGVHLEDCMERIFSKNDTKDRKVSEGGQGGSDERYNCPFCLEPILESEMDQHLNLCFSVEEI